MSEYESYASTDFHMLNRRIGGYQSKIKTV